MSIRNKLIAAITLAVLLASGIFYIIGTSITRKNIQQITEDNLTDMVEIAHSLLMVYNGSDLDHIRNAFNDKIHIGKNGFLFVIDLDGNLIVHQKSEGENWKDRPFIKYIIDNRTGYHRYLSPMTKTYKVAAFKYCEIKDFIIIASNFENDALARPMAQIARSSASILLPVLIIIIIVFSLLINKIVNHPLCRVISRLDNISQGDGDLTQRISHETHDEIGDLADKFNVFIGKLHDIICDVVKNTDELSSAAVILSQKAAHMADDTKIVNNESSQVANSGQNASGKIKQISANTDECPILYQP